MIPEPQKTYLLELLTTLGPAADEFVLVGGQALKFVLAEARATKDFDFLLDAIALREKPANVAEKLMALGYTVVPESRNFQFGVSSMPFERKQSWAVPHGQPIGPLG